MGGLIKYTLYLENVPMETRVSLYDTFDPVSWTGVSCNKDISVIEFFLLANEYFEDYAKLPPKLPHYCPAGSSSWKNLILSAAGSYSITARHFFSGNRKLTSQGSRASNSV